MKLKNTKIAIALILMMSLAKLTSAQQATLEMTGAGSSNTLLGPSNLPVVINFREDLTNATAGTFFNQYNPALTVTTSLTNQQYNTTYGNISTGITFGGGTTASSITPGAIQQSFTNPVFNQFGATLVQPPLNGMFVSSPTGTVVPTNFQQGGRGVGLDVEATQGGSALDLADDGVNFGMAIYTTVEPLFDANLPKNGRYYYGDIVLNFSRPVKNPVIHLGGLGGSYNYQPLSGGPRLISYFSSELELQNTGVSSTKMSGNENFNITGNNILNSSATPNGGSYNEASNPTTQGGFLAYGAATGSVRLNGTFSQIVYKVYVRGSANSDFNFSQGLATLPGATTARPLNGDLFYLAVSLNKPTQQISGNVLIDKDGLTDNNINKSASVENPRTNVGGSLFANLLNSVGQVVASTPVSSDGSYLFDAVPVGTYTVQLTTVASAGTYTTPATAPATILPSGWANTGEFNGSTPGSDGTVNGRSASIVVAANDIRNDVNFGIELLPESVSFSVFIPTPQLNSVITLNGTLPVLTGSDPEDLPTQGSLSLRTARIDSLPSNTQLLYGGVPVTLGQTITNYNPSLLQIRFTIATPAGETAFKYSFVDAAGFPDPTPAKYTIRWPNDGPLNITLSDFTAVKNNCFSNLNWKTSSEINSDKFEVEVSSNVNADFKTIGTIAASLNSNTAKAYQFSYAMESGVVYYFRLKMFNKDGSFTYSVIRQLSCSDVKTQIAIAPNPVKDIFTISGMAKGRNTIMVFSTDGKMIKSQIANNTTAPVDISSLSSGLYVVRILNENGTSQTERVVKK